jgi:hypothetical protein
MTAPHLFTPRQSVRAYRQCQDLIAACDREIEQQLAAFDSQVDPRATPLPKPKERRDTYELCDSG